ncbi:MAG: type II toxin-antitoxin system toxin [Anaerolineae bacterium]
MNDLVTNKIQSIQRCVLRAREEYAADPDSFAINYTRQDAAILNVLRACEQTIDLANHIIKNYKMGIPTASAESFDLLHKQGVITAELAENLRRMVHFRNIVIHQYQQLDLAIVQTVIVSGLDDLIQFGDRVLEFIHSPAS